MNEHEDALSYTTETRAPGEEEWRYGPRLDLLFVPGAPVEPARLGWRGEDGAEAEVLFTPGLDAFAGTRTGADGVSREWRGRRGGGAAGTRPHRFTTGDGEQVLLLLEDGGALPVRVSWTDREGGAGSILLAPADPGEGGEAAGEVTGLVRSIRAGDEYSAAGEVAVNLLDATSDKWLSRRSTDRVVFALGTPARVRSYSLRSANDFDDRDPCDWVLEGSADGRTWTVLDRRSDEAFHGRHTVRGFAVRSAADDRPQRYLRLDITRNRGAYEIQLNQVRFFSRELAYRDFRGYRSAAGGGPEPFHGSTGQERTSGLPATAGQWRTYLSSYAAAMAETRGWSAEQAARPGAPSQRLEALEQRLGRALPPGYRAFLSVSDGWGALGEEGRSLHSADALAWAGEPGTEPGPRAVDPKDLGAVGPLLVVSEHPGGALWLLDAGDAGPDGEWAAHTWSGAGTEPDTRRRSFAALVDEDRAWFEELHAPGATAVHPGH